MVRPCIIGDYQLPSDSGMDEVIKTDEKAHIGHFYAAARHTMQVDFNTYVRDLMKEIARGKKRARHIA